MSKPLYKIGEVVKVHSDNDNENYSSFRDRPLKIIHVATSTEQHPGYDDSMKGQGLYDFIDAVTGMEIGCSLYDYELTKH
jgi:hypothetical protein